MSAKKIWTVAIISIAIVGLAVAGFFILNSTSSSLPDLSVQEAESIVNEELDSYAISDVSGLIAEKNEITVENIEVGDENNYILTCTVTTPDVHSAISPLYNEFLSTDAKKKNGTMFKSALDFKLEFQEKLLGTISALEPVEKSCTIQLFGSKKGFFLYAEDAVIDTVYGGVVTLNKEVMGFSTYVDASGEEKTIESANVKKGLVNCFELRYDNEKPDVSTSAIGKWWKSVQKDFHNNFIKHGRWRTIVKGLWQTLRLTFFSLIIGIVIGFLIAFIRCTYLKTRKRGIILKLLNAISQVYLTITRGTPVVVQIMIIYFVIFMPVGVDKFLAAVICFGLNSGAYVAEIVRGGIMSIDEGQTEAGRSLGFGYMETMWYIVFPQAFKAVLPSLANEFVVLLKETSIAFYIGLGDLMYSVNAIRAATYSPFMPLIAAALIYLVMVIVLSKLVSLLERRLRNNER